MSFMERAWIPGWVRALWALAWLLAGAGVAAGQTQPAQPRADAAAPPVRVVVSIAPLKGLVEPLLPAGGSLTLLIPPGVSEHGYEIGPRALADLARADVVVLVGLGLEPSVDRFLAERPRAGRRIVRLAEAAGVAGEAGGRDEPGPGDGHDGHEGHDVHEGHDHTVHTHDEHGACVHIIDPHLWLDPVRAVDLVHAAAAAIGEVAAGRGGEPARAAVAASRDGVVARLEGLDRAYRARLASAPRRTVVVTHDAFGWLARRYDFQTIAIKGLNAGEPTPRALEAAMAAVRAHGLTAVFAEPQLSPAAAQRVADAAGVKVLTLDPLGDGDYFGLMLRNLDALAEAMGVPGETPGDRSLLARPGARP